MMLSKQKNDYLSFVHDLSNGNGEWSQVPGIIRLTFQTIITGILQEQQNEINNLKKKMKILENRIDSKANADDIMRIIDGGSKGGKFKEYNELLKRVIEINNVKISRIDEQMLQFRKSLKTIYNIFKESKRMNQDVDMIVKNEIKKYSVGLENEIKKKLTNNTKEMKQLKDHYNNEIRNSLINLNKIRNDISLFLTSGK